MSEPHISQRVSCGDRPGRVAEIKNGLIYVRFDSEDFTRPFYYSAFNAYLLPADEKDDWIEEFFVKL